MPTPHEHRTGLYWPISNPTQEPGEIDLPEPDLGPTLEQRLRNVRAFLDIWNADPRGDMDNDRIAVVYAPDNGNPHSPYEYLRAGDLRELVDTLDALRAMNATPRKWMLPAVADLEGTAIEYEWRDDESRADHAEELELEHKRDSDR